MQCYSCGWIWPNLLGERVTMETLCPRCGYATVVSAQPDPHCEQCGEPTGHYIEYVDSSKRFFCERCMRHQIRSDRERSRQ